MGGGRSDIGSGRGMITRNGHVKELTYVSYGVLLTLIDVFKTFFSQKGRQFFFSLSKVTAHEIFFCNNFFKSLLTNAVILD